MPFVLAGMHTASSYSRYLGQYANFRFLPRSDSPLNFGKSLKDASAFHSEAG
jgi:hypothetical protein